jgi:hypothetical protein
MDRNWLIRTAQNQILGPVAKQKLLEFVQKGALGMMDEVSSGNGYWFSLKEKELVEKYLHGDLPQGYNPISESRSVLSKKDNPDKTTSINTAPVNNTTPADHTANNITQIIKLDFESLNASIPKTSDLELPDLEAPVKKAPVALAVESTKLPNQDDLEFPDVDLISSSVSASFDGGDLALQASLTSAKIPMPIPKPAHVQAAEPASISAEDMILPDADDLAFPDMDDMKTSPKIDKGMVDLSHQYTRTVALDTQQASVVLPIEEEDDGDNLSFEVTSIIKTHTVVEEEVAKAFEQANKANIIAANADTPLKLDRNNVKASGGAMTLDTTVRNRSAVPNEDKKLLHERKTKSSMSKGAALRDPSRENHPKDAHAEPQKRNDNYIFFILIILVLIIVAVFFYFKEILNKPLPM